MTSFKTSCSNGKHLTRSSMPTVLFERWRQHTNTIRLHSALGYRPPAPGAWQVRCQRLFTQPPPACRLSHGSANV
ncbi:MAG: transposase [Planctomycetes bacterium]|nr:transposase [Planctomycetota bacterium]